MPILKTFWSVEDGAFITISLQYPGLSAFGDTKEESIKEAHIAILGFKEVEKEDGER